jgi:hypothetical protein
MAGTLAKMEQFAVLEATAVMQQSADKVRLLMVQTFIYSAVWREVWTRTVSTRCQRRKESLRSILALHPETALLDVLYGTLGYFHPVYC